MFQDAAKFIYFEEIDNTCVSDFWLYFLHNLCYEKNGLSVICIIGN